MTLEQKTQDSHPLLDLSRHRLLPLVSALVLPFSGSEAAITEPQIEDLNSKPPITSVIKWDEFAAQLQAEQQLGLPSRFPLTTSKSTAETTDPSPLSLKFFEELPGGHILKDGWERVSGDAIFSAITAIGTAAVTIVFAWLHRRDWIHRNFKKQVTGFVLQADSDSGPAAVTFLETSISTLLNNSPHSPALVNKIAKTVTPENPFLGFKDLPGSDISTDAEQIFAEISNTVSSNAGTQEILAADPCSNELVDTREDLVAITNERYNRHKLRIIDLPVRQAVGYLGDLGKAIDQFLLHPESCVEVKGRFISALKLAVIAFYDNPGRFRRAYLKLSNSDQTAPTYSWEAVSRHALYLRDLFDLSWQSAISKLSAEVGEIKDRDLRGSQNSRSTKAGIDTELADNSFEQNMAPLNNVDPERKYYAVIKLSRLLPRDRKGDG